MLKSRWASLAGAAVLVVTLVLIVIGLSGSFDRSGDANRDRGDPVTADPPDLRDGDGLYVEYWWGGDRTRAPEGEFVDVAVNQLMSCGIRVGGELACWGQVEGELPQGWFSQVELSSGVPAFEGTGCVLSVSGAVECWVSPDWTSGGPWLAPDGVFTDIAAAAGRWCAVGVDGAVVCWGEGLDGHDVLAESGFVEVSAHRVGWSDEFLVCALDAAGAVACWRDAFGDETVQLPSGPFESVSAAVYRSGAAGALSLGEMRLGSAVASEGDAVTVVGDVCGVRRGGRLECWNVSGQGPSPLVEPTGEFVKVAVGPRHGCALAADGSVRCWGDNEAGQRGPQLRRVFEWVVGDAVCERDGLLPPLSCERWADGEPIARDDPDHPYAGVPDDQVDPHSGPFSDVWVTDAGSCGSRIDGVLVCWGDPGAGFDPALGPFTQIAAGRLHACGLRPDGTAACWALLDDSLVNADPSSLDSYQLLLRRYHDEHWRDQDIAPEGRFAQLAAGETHTCALDDDGRIVCWGQPDEHPEPPLERFSQLSAAAGLSCASDGDHAAYCWGHIDGASVPPTRLSDEPITHVLATASAHRPCVTDSDSNLRCSHPSIADGPLWWVGPFTAIDARGPEACGIRQIDNAQICWDPRHPRLGPSTDDTAKNYAQLAYAYEPLSRSATSCTLDIEGAVECDSRVPSVTYPPTGQFTKIAISVMHGCGIRADRTITCWGNDASMEIDE